MDPFVQERIADIDWPFQAGIYLRKLGYLVMAIDPPSHGKQILGPEDDGLHGWAWRIIRNARTRVPGVDGASAPCGLVRACGSSGTASAVICRFCAAMSGTGSASRIGVAVGCAEQPVRRRDDAMSQVLG